MQGIVIYLQGTEVPGDVDKGTVEGLVEGKDYEFRVIAHNKAGNSEPSMVSPPVKTKARKGTQHFFLSFFLLSCLISMI